MTDYLVMESNPMSVKALQPKYMDCLLYTSDAADE